MRLFNTLSQQIEELRPRGDAVTLYVCGITPYDTTHLGHASINVVYDTLRRYLTWRGQPVKYVQNVTDIDDDILRKAKERGLAWDELGRQETERYLTDLRDLNVALPDFYVKASDETATMIELIQALLAKNFAYARDGWVYYRVKADSDFGRLAEAAGYIGYDAWLLTANERGNSRMIHEKRTRWISCSGRRSSQESRRGPARGDQDGRAGTSSAAACQSSILAHGSTSTAVDQISFFRITPARSRRARTQLGSAHLSRSGCIARWWGWMARR